MDKICFTCGSMRQPLLTSAKTQEARIMVKSVTKICDTPPRSLLRGKARINS